MWIDLSLHAVPVLALLAGERVISLSTYIEQMLIRPLSPDFFLRERKYKPPVSTYGAVILAAFSALAYGAWAEYCASHNGTCKPSLASKVSWVVTDRFGETNLHPVPYPFLTISPLPVRAAIYASATGFALMAFWGLNAMHE
jgi:hypothetical protein